MLLMRLIGARVALAQRVGFATTSSALRRAQKHPKEEQQSFTLDAVQMSQLPPRPKRPATGYNLFCTEKFEEARSVKQYLAPSFRSNRVMCNAVW